MVEKVDCQTTVAKEVEYNHGVIDFSMIVGVVAGCHTEKMANSFKIILRKVSFVIKRENLNLVKITDSLVKVAAHSVVITKEMAIFIVVSITKEWAIFAIMASHQTMVSLYSVGFMANSNTMVEFTQAPMALRIIQEFLVVSKLK
jgi:hypothetical protein